MGVQWLSGWQYSVGATSPRKERDVAQPETVQSKPNSVIVQKKHHTPEVQTQNPKPETQDF